jgi:phospholipid N-methyltransferase
MSDFTLFLGKFLRHGTKIASIAPSSPWLSRTTVRHIDWASVEVVVELGAGTGPITQVMVERARPETTLVVIERDPDFARLLRERYADRPNVKLVEGDVRDLKAILDGLGIRQADHVVSGLPIPSFPRDLQHGVFRAVQAVLKPEGTYSQITELPWVYLGLYRRYFDEVRFGFEPRNLPPAGAYFCRRLKPQDRWPSL